jgi:chromate transporter
MTAAEFEDAIAACNLLPGPASTQLAIYCAWRLLVPAGWQRARNASRRRWLGYLGLGAAASASVGPWMVLLILGCGLIELRRRLEVRRWGCR